MTISQLQYYVSMLLQLPHKVMLEENKGWKSVLHSIVEMLDFVGDSYAVILLQLIKYKWPWPEPNTHWHTFSTLSLQSRIIENLIIHQNFHIIGKHSGKLWIISTYGPWILLVCPSHVCNMFLIYLTGEIQLIYGFWHTFSRRPCRADI